MASHYPVRRKRAAAAPRNKQAEPEQRRRRPPIENGEAVDDPHRLARVFLERLSREFGGAVLKFWRGQWWRWDGAVFNVWKDRSLTATVNREVKKEFDRAWLRGPLTCVPRVTRGLVGNVVQALEGECELGDDVEQPAWVGGARLCPAVEYLAAKNGLVHIPSFLKGESCLSGHTPEFFSGHVLEYDFEPAAPQPAEWLKFLGQLWPGDPESIACLQEWMGYLLTANTSQQKILALVGPPRSGKGTIGRVCEELLGRHNATGLSLTTLGGRFGLSTLMGKTLAVVPDAHLGWGSDRSLIGERLLSISGEDSQTIERKNRESVTTRLPTRFMLLANQLPNLDNLSGALASRLLFLRLENTWTGKEDPHLTARLYAERPGILLWALEGLRRLRDRGRFVQPQSGEAHLQLARETANPVCLFLEDRCELGPGLQVTTDDLFGAWQQWATANGYTSHGTKQAFGAALLAAGKVLKPVRQVKEQGKQCRVYDGITLRE
jgi:putative DNA primase/helicase